MSSPPGAARGYPFPGSGGVAITGVGGVGGVASVGAVLGAGGDPARPSPYPLYLPSFRDSDVAVAAFHQSPDFQLQLARYQQLAAQHAAQQHAAQAAQVAHVQQAAAAAAAAAAAVHHAGRDDAPVVRRRPSLLPPGGMHDWSEHNGGGSAHRSSLEVAAAAAAAAGGYGPVSARALYANTALVDGQGGVSMAGLPPGVAGVDPHKRPRLSQPLVIDTSVGGGGTAGGISVKKEPAYIPQVEAISPTLPEERSSKDELVAQINKLDREISQLESTTNKMRKKQADLEAHETRKGAEGDECATGTERQMTPAQVVYADNRSKAQAAHALLNGFGPKISLPLYNQPTDTAVYHENKKKFATFKSRLSAFLKRRHQETSKRDEYLSKNYTHQMGLWIKKQERHIGNKAAAAARRVKDQKLREFFEKQFPELKKQREEKERFSRAGQRVRSDAEMEEIMDGIQQQEDEEKRMRSYAVVPPRLLDRWERSIRFLSENSRVDDLASEYKERQSLTHWTEAEKAIFREKYVQFPKNFGSISAFIERKTTADCVQYYYMSKKSENYKRLVRKHNARKRTRNNNVASNRSQQQNQQQPQQAGALAGAAASSLSANSGGGVSVLPQRRQAASSDSSSACTTSNGVMSPTECALCKCSLIVGPGGVTGASEEGSNASVAIGAPTPGATATTAGADAATAISTTGSADNTGASGSVAASGYVEDSESRILTKANCDLYGLTAEQVVAAGGELRVCARCRFNTNENVAMRLCPIVGCERRVRRLRTLLPRWLERRDQQLAGQQTGGPGSPDLKQLIPNGVHKCCSVCFNNLTRRYEPHEGRGHAEAWTNAEVELIRTALRIYGTDWAAVSSVVVTKSRLLCKNFYALNKRKHNLHHMVSIKKII